MPSFKKNLYETENVEWMGFQNHLAKNFLLLDEVTTAQEGKWLASVLGNV